LGSDELASSAYSARVDDEDSQPTLRKLLFEEAGVHSGKEALE
jgi:hypothetical protein